MQVGFIGAGKMARALASGRGDPVLCADLVVDVPQRIMTAAVERDGVRAAFASAMDDVVGA